MSEPGKQRGKPFDVSLKNLIGDNPKDWLTLFDLPSNTPIVELDSDVSGMSLAADRLYKIGTGRNAYGLHAELESGHKGKSLPRRLLEYSVFAETRHGLLFRSVAVLLTKGASSPAITGRLERRLPNGMLIHAFHYDVIRVYEIPAEELLQSGLSVVPLASLGSLPDGDLPRIVDRMGRRFRTEATDTDDLRRLWTAAWLLMSARHSPRVAESLLKGAVEAVLKLEDFPLYDYLKEKGMTEGRAVGIEMGRAEGRVEGRVEGRTEGVRDMVLRIGAKRFGEPSDEVRSALVAVSDLERLQQFAERLFEKESWEELLTNG
ncbi:MAG: hypothetical protein H8F28_19595 [Fibrella sp.]|nr:hypothetical protein [Armatimonadota bacterium]